MQKRFNFTKEINNIDNHQRILIHQTSVWNNYLRVCREKLNDDGYFDLSQLNKLYVIGAKDFLVSCRKKLGLSQRACKETIGIKNITNYENSEQAIPFRILLKFSELANEDLCSYLKKSDKIFFSGGMSPPIEASLLLKPERFIDLLKLVKPSKLKIRNIIYPNILTPFDHYNIHYNKHNTPYFHSALLWSFIHTYYKSEKESRLIIPSYPYTNDIINKGADPHIIAGSLLLAEGSRNVEGFNFSNKSRALHNLLVDAIYLEHSVYPTSYHLDTGDGCYRTYYSSKKALEIRKRFEDNFGSIRTKPSINRPLEFLKMTQPNLNNIKKRIDKKIALRVFSVTEGCVNLKVVDYNRKKNEITVNPIIHISCANPSLLLSLYNLSSSLGFTPSLFKGETWSGWAGLKIPSHTDVVHFLEIGGFLEMVPVARTDSYFYGYNKQQLFISILELRKRLENDSHLRKLNINNLKKLAFDILTKKEYGSPDVYIKIKDSKNIFKRLSHSNLLLRLKDDVKMIESEPKSYLEQLGTYLNKKSKMAFSEKSLLPA